MQNNRYVRFLLKLIMSAAVFILVHFLMSTVIRHEPYVFNVILDVIAPVFFAIADTEVEKRSHRRRTAGQ